MGEPVSTVVDPANAAQVDAQIGTAFDLLRSGQVEQADRLCRSLQEGVTSVRLDLLACEIAEARGEFPRALELVSGALERHGDDVELLLKRAQMLMHLNRRWEAVQAAYRAAEICPPDVRLLYAIARIHVPRNDPADAMPLLLRALDLAPGNSAILYDAALCHFFLNQMNEAAVYLNRLLQKSPYNAIALFLQSQLRTQTRDANHIGDLRRAIQQPRRHAKEVIPTYFALAKELEDIGEYEESFLALREANRLKRSTLSYDVLKDVQDMQNVAKHYSREALAGIKAGDPSPGPIFILGMPRTGTTLVERILASHSDVVSLGEIIDFPVEMTRLAERTHARLGLKEPGLLQASLQMDFAELGRNYLAAVRSHARGRQYTIDKLPFNFRYCGLIHKALPNATILHLTRDPLDTCYAIYKTLFVNAYHYSYQLDELAEFYVSYRRMMDYWHAAMPGVIHDVSYEELVADPPAHCRKLLEWCGLPWEDDVLQFHRSRAASTTASAAQVRQPVYTSSVRKWRKFAKQLQPVLRRLADAGLVDEKGTPLPSSAGVTPD